MIKGKFTEDIWSQRDEDGDEDGSFPQQLFQLVDYSQELFLEIKKRNHHNPRQQKLIMLNCFTGNHIPNPQSRHETRLTAEEIQSPLSEERK